MATYTAPSPPTTPARRGYEWKRDFVSGRYYEKRVTWFDKLSDPWQTIIFLSGVAGTIVTVETIIGFIWVVSGHPFLPMFHDMINLSIFMAALFAVIAIGISAGPYDNC